MALFLYVRTPAIIFDLIRPMHTKVAHTVFVWFDSKIQVENRRKSLTTVHVGLPVGSALQEPDGD